MTAIWVPPGVECPHPESALVGSFVPDLHSGEGRHVLSIICRSCGSAWDQETVPMEVLATVVHMLEAGKTRRIDLPADL